MTTNHLPILQPGSQVDPRCILFFMPSCRMVVTKVQSFMLQSNCCSTVCHGTPNVHTLCVRRITVTLKYDAARCVHREVQEMNNITYIMAPSVERVRGKSIPRLYSFLKVSDVGTEHQRVIARDPIKPSSLARRSHSHRGSLYYFIIICFDRSVLWFQRHI